MNANEKSKICLFIPCYNVDHAILSVLESIPALCMDRLGRVFVIDNGSTDNTIDVICSFIAKRQDSRFEFYQNRENYTLGGSTILALSMAIAQGFDFLVCMHGDGQAQAADVVKLMDESKAGVDLVLGSRLMKESRVDHYSRQRLWANLFFARLQSLIVGRELGDIGAIVSFNLKLISKLPYDSLPFDMGYQPLLILCAIKKFPSLVIREVPISWGAAERSNVHVLLYALTHAMRLILLCFGFQFQSGKKLSHFKTSRKTI